MAEVAIDDAARSLIELIYGVGQPPRELNPDDGCDQLNDKEQHGNGNDGIEQNAAKELGSGEKAAQHSRRARIDKKELPRGFCLAGRDDSGGRLPANRPECQS